MENLTIWPNASMPHAALISKRTQCNQGYVCDCPHCLVHKQWSPLACIITGSFMALKSITVLNAPFTG